MEAAAIEAQLAFGAVLEALATSDVEESRAETLVSNACATVDALVQALEPVPEFGASYVMEDQEEDEEEEARARVRAVCVSWESVVKENRGVKIAQRLESIAPNLVASWLDALKSLGSCAVAAKETMILRAEVNSELGFGADLVNWPERRFLSAAWLELKDRGGLRSSRWRARVSAAEFLASLAEYDFAAGSTWNERSLALLEELLRALVFGTGLADSQWQVRQAVVPAVTRLLTASMGCLAQSSWANLNWGMLAICVDPQPEVQATARDSVLQHLIPPSALHSKGVVQGLLDRFIAGCFNCDSNSLQENNMVLNAALAAVRLELVPHQTGFEVEEHGNVSIDRIPILVVATSFALADSEKKGNNMYSASLQQLLRSLGPYLTSLLVMLNPAMHLYECDKLARYCKRRGVLDDITASELEKVPTATSLKGLVIALEASGSVMKSFSADSSVESLGNLQLDALQHASEMLRVPFELTRNYKDEKSVREIENYLFCSELYLNMALTLVKNPAWTAQQAWIREETMCNIFLNFSALASGIIESERTWVDETGLCKLCNDILLCFSKTLKTESNEVMSPSGGNGSKVSSLETLVLRLLPKILSSLKDVLKAGTRSTTLDNESAIPKMEDLPAAIISAHQLRWCLVQVHYPNFKLQSEMAIRTALTALDHYSPLIKREGMKAFIHLSANVSVAELCGFKDAILDAVTRNLIGSEDLWPVAVEMGVALVTKIEGGNPRSHWYGAIMKEMLEDLDRHRSDEARRVIWLQLVTPQLESMGIFLVAHFKRLLPLLYSWLHAQDETTQLLVLENLRRIIKSTWPRIPFHASRMQEELARAKRDGHERKSSPKVFSAIDDVERLLDLIALRPITERN